MSSKKSTVTLVNIVTIIAILTSKQKKEHILAIKESFLSLKMHLILKKCFQPDTKERSDSASLHECHLMGILWHDYERILFEGLSLLRNNYLISITTTLTVVSFNYHMPSHHHIHKSRRLITIDHTFIKQLYQLPSLCNRMKMKYSKVVAIDKRGGSLWSLVWQEFLLNSSHANNDPLH